MSSSDSLNQPTCHRICLVPELNCTPICSAARLYGPLATRLDSTQVATEYEFVAADLMSWNHDNVVDDSLPGYGTLGPCPNVGTSINGKIRVFVNHLKAALINAGERSWIVSPLECNIGVGSDGSIQQPDLPGPVWFTNPPTRGTVKPTFVPRAGGGGGGKDDEETNICAGYFIGKYLGNEKVTLYRINKDGELESGPTVTAVFGV